MSKDFIICLCAIVIGVCGWYGETIYDKIQAANFIREQAAMAAVIEQRQAAEKIRLVTVVQEKNLLAKEAASIQQKQVVKEDRQKIEAEVARCKLSSIMLGPPDIAIIDKRSYEPGEQVTLPSGKILAVQSISAEAVVLFDGQNGYRLSLPAAPNPETKVRR